MSQEPSSTLKLVQNSTVKIERPKKEHRAKRHTKKVIIFGDDKFLCAIDGFMMETNYVIDSRDLYELRRLAGHENRLRLTDWYSSSLERQHVSMKSSTKFPDFANIFAIPFRTIQ